MFYFARTKVVEERSPLLVFFEIFSDMLREQNMAGIAAIHHPLRHVDPGAGKISSFIYIDHATNWPAVDPHSNLQPTICREHTADLHRALHGLLWVRIKHERHPVAGRDFKQAARGFGSLKLLGSLHNVV